MKTTSVIKDVVEMDHRTAAIFQSYGIDFRHKGNRSISEVCEDRLIDPQILIDTLSEAIRTDAKIIFNLGKIIQTPARLRLLK